MKDDRLYDVAIVGGGIVGMSLAIGLAGAGLATALVERTPLAMLGDPGRDGRGSAVAAGSQRILEGIGVWELLGSEAEPIREIRVADNSAHGFLHYDFSDVGDGPLGWIVENERLRDALLRRVFSDDIAIFEREVDGFLSAPRFSILKLKGSLDIKARLLVAADGRNSPLREIAGIPVISWNYPQISMVCTIQHEVSHFGIAQEHFQRGGPFAVLPMTENRASIVWTEQTNVATDILSLSDELFVKSLQNRLGKALGKIQVLSQRWAYPLSLVHATRYTAERFALIGDAAHAIHPIAGQGLNLGIRDVAVLAEVIVDAARLGLDPGLSNVLNRYQSWRRPDNLLMIGVTDSLNRLFSNGFPPLKLARDAGLSAVHHINPLKRFLMRHAMGVVGPLPRLSRGEPL
ncbi:MAG: UbiH/UbiF/VisC/COQ6 family ubiquinone biosynthesis hydroxylase [Pseudomonadota bacterium]|nr:UbiH/UbiF/VisC/COQ6 family ubiquinone biosynthesis hydroxylase [Pseudomonadota bacterium]